MIKYFIFTIIILLFSSASSLDKAKEKLKSNNIKESIQLYKSAASKGNKDALFRLGVFSYKGKYLKKDLNKAFYYFKEAANLGHLKAKYNLALLYSRENTSFFDYTKSYNTFLDLALKNYGAAQNKIGIFLTYGFGVNKDYKLAVKWYEKSLKNGYSKASCNLAYMYANGFGVFPNFGKARELAQEGYDNNDPLCTKLYNDFNLHKYTKDKGFKFGFYK